MKGFGEEKTGLNRPYWIESVFPDDLQFEDADKPDYIEAIPENGYAKLYTDMF